jgi:Na+-transporting NADH:ubiquinone oxidoreductase subunit B
MALYNTGYQAHRAIEAAAQPLDTWQTAAMQCPGAAVCVGDFAACVVHGALYFLPVMLVTYAVGGAWEGLFAQVRGHEINEGFLVTGMLIPLTLPPTIPLWQVAIGTSFGVVIGKEIFGGTGMNILNPALTARAFLFFAYPARSRATCGWRPDRRPTAAPCPVAGRLHRRHAGWRRARRAAWRARRRQLVGRLLGFIPGSMGETSALACLLGARAALVTGCRLVAHHGRPSRSAPIAMALMLNAIGSTTNPYSRCRSGGTWCSAAGRSAWCTWRPTRCRRRTRMPAAGSTAS